MKPVEAHCFRLFVCPQAQSVPFKTEMGLESKLHKLQTSHL